MTSEIEIHTCSHDEERIRVSNDEEHGDEFLVVNERPIAASTLGAYHHNSCQLYLHMVTKKPWNLPKTAQISSTKTRSSAFRLAVTGKGNVWEDSIRERLRAKGLLFECKDAAISSASASSSSPSSLEQILNHIIQVARASSSSSSSEHFYVMDSQFSSPNFLHHFRAKKSINLGKRVQFSTFKPDFIELVVKLSSSSLSQTKVEVKYTVIDAKASSHTKVSHQVQIGFYWLALQEVFGSEVTVSREGHEYRINFVPDDIGYVWLHHQEDPTPFSLPLLRPLLEDFLFAKLPTLLSCPAEEVYWHYNPVCSSCEFKVHCRTNTIVNKTLSSIPHLSMGDHKLLKSVVNQFASSTTTTTTEIERLHELMEPSSRQILAKSYPATTERLRRILCIPDIKVGSSPLLTSVIEQTPKAISRPCLTLPASEDIAVYLTLLIDPGTEELLGYSIRQHRRGDDEVTLKTKTIEKKEVGVTNSLSDSFVQDLSETIESLRDLSDTVQFFIFGQLEHTSFLNILVAKACREENGEHIQQCIAALADQTDVLMTAVQPELLDYVLQAPGSKDTKQTLKDFLLGCGANPEEVDKKLVAQLRDWIKRIVGEGKRGRKPPRVSVLHTAIRQLLSIPEPGFYGLREVVAHMFKEEGESLKLMSDEELYNFWAQGDEKEAISKQLELQNEFQDRVTLRIREMFGNNLGRVLPADAVRLNPLLIKACKNENLRRLLFMKQYEAVVKLEQLRFERFSRTGRAIYLEFHQKIENSSKVELEVEGDEPKPAPAPWKEECLIECIVTQGKEFIEVEGTSPDGTPTPLLFKWLFVPDGDEEQGFTGDMTFNDLLYYDAFPLKIKLEEPNLGLANIVGVSYPGSKSPEDRRTYVVLQIHGPLRRRKFITGSQFFLRERYVDFNIKKCISNLIQLDKECVSGVGSGFISLLENPISEVEKAVIPPVERKAYEKREDELRRFYYEFYDLHDKWPKKLSFHSSQRKAFLSILLNSFSIVWGPPGSGKTHTLALSVLRYLEVVASLSKGQQKCHVLMTAFTHIAIQQFLKKFEELLQEMRKIPNTFAKGFLESLTVLRLTGENDQKAPVPDSNYAVVAGTVWSIFKWQTKHSKKKPEFDLLIIDEGSQLPVADAAIAFRCLSTEPKARVVIGGDHFQLPPVFSARYPVFEPMLFGSILQCLIRTADNHNISLSGAVTSLGPTTTILKENARMVDSLAEFTQQIYGKKFKVLQSRREVGSSEQRKGLDEIACPLVQQFLRSVFDNSTRNHLVTVKLGIKKGPSDLAPVEKHLSAEANVIARILLGLRQCFQKEKILVATPHRAQRSLINSKIIEISGEKMSDLKVDTVERLQGDEAPIVLGAYGFTNTLQLEGELDFIFNRNRLNVAISRAQYLCLLVVSENVLNPSMVVLASPERRDAFAHIKSFVNSSFVFDWPLQVNPNTLEITDFSPELETTSASLIPELSKLALM